ncbi:OsmC family protein [Janibacter terrae]|uniref:OsmC family protein n=1 Tax=Janibacter terrae TaxID=103817 RepID=A0ABZ2FF81_9MICO|nr:OsmC family protein [Janibacter terrae]MBA4085188.1 OsmC family peroxiredoxin [Kytococcus sp.]HBO54745.1 OsmC family peroxiredoxin [Janibacter terrae]HCE60340.1 OsmC family peroxiredoxin [Janibacter terrae]
MTDEETTGGTGPGHRSVELTRLALGRYEIGNVRGGTITIGDGSTDDFTPVELLLAAIAGCSAVDVDHITSRRAEPDSFVVVAEGDKVSTPERGNHMSDLEVTFRIGFPEGEGGDAARAAFPRSVVQSRDRLCTVSRTVQLGTPIEMSAEDA